MKGVQCYELFGVIALKNHGLYIYIYNFEITCHVMIVAVLEIIYIYQSHRAFMEFIIR